MLLKINLSIRIKRKLSLLIFLFENVIFKWVKYKFHLIISVIEKFKEIIKVEILCHKEIQSVI